MFIKVSLRVCVCPFYTCLHNEKVKLTHEYCYMSQNSSKRFSHTLLHECSFPETQCLFYQCLLIAHDIFILIFLVILHVNHSFLPLVSFYSSHFFVPTIHPAPKGYVLPWCSGAWVDFLVSIPYGGMSWSASQQAGKEGAEFAPALAWCTRLQIEPNFKSQNSSL